MNQRIPILILAIFLFSFLSPPAASPATGKEPIANEKASSAPGKPAPDTKVQVQAKEGAKRPITGEPVEQELVKKGARIQFSISPYQTKSLIEGGLANVRFKITDETSGNPIHPLSPAVWIDAKGESKESKKVPTLSCGDKVKWYLRGTVAYQPLIDLNSYYILALNNDFTISVIDPLKGIAGMTQLFTMLYLKSTGEDWDMSSDEKKLFVTMPKVNMVAVADLENFTVTKNIPVGNKPVRIAFQPDGKYLWAANDGAGDKPGSVSVIDAAGLNVVAEIPLEAGHHEIAFSANSLFVFVTSRDKGTVSVIDTQKLKKVKELETGSLPVSIGYSKLAKSVYIANEGDGSIVVLNEATHEIAGRIATKPGLKTIRFDLTGRWGFAANAKENLVYIIDASTNKLAHTVEVTGEPDQIVFTAAAAYVRLRQSGDVKMILLLDLEKDKTPPVVSITAGEKPPAASPFTTVADSITATQEGNSVLITNPADKKIYFYGEGMSAPEGSYMGVGGVTQRATRSISRVLRMSEPGVYGAQFRIPVSGEFEVAFILDSPQIVHCFQFTAVPNPVLVKKDPRIPDVEVLTKETKFIAKEPFKLRFKAISALTKEPITDIKDLVVQAMTPAPSWNSRYVAAHVGGGMYEVNLNIPFPGLCYVTMDIPSRRIDFRQLPNLILEIKKPQQEMKGVKEEKNGLRQQAKP
jgi:YVTN family beta-propeller protein